MFLKSGEPAGNYDLCQGERAIAAVLGRKRACEIAGRLMEQVPPSRQKRSGESKKRGRSACIYIPHDLERGAAKRLIEAAGREDAARLVRTFRGETLWFSNCNGVMLRFRNGVIRAERERGRSIKVLAVSFDLSQRAIRRICNGVLTNRTSLHYA